MDGAPVMPFDGKAIGARRGGKSAELVRGGEEQAQPGSGASGGWLPLPDPQHCQILHCVG